MENYVQGIEIIEIVSMDGEKNTGLYHASSLGIILCNSQGIIYHGLHDIIPCISALGEIRLGPPMSELSKHINIIYTSLYLISEGRRRQ